MKALPLHWKKEKREVKGVGRERRAMSDNRIIIRPLNSKRSSYCMLFLSRKYTQSYYSAVGTVADDISPI